MAVHKATDVDKHVGRRIRARRIESGLTQSALADQIGKTYQQQHKYEQGINRVSASVMHDIAVALGVTPDYFFDGLHEPPRPEATRSLERACLDVAEALRDMKPEHRGMVTELARRLARADRKPSCRGEQHAC